MAIRDPSTSSDEPDDPAHGVGTSSGHEILLTGASGFLGHYLLAELLDRPTLRCHVLLRPPLSDSLRRLTTLLGELKIDLAEQIRYRRVVPIEGTLPDALPNTDLSGVSTFINAAGCTVFDADASGELMRTNVEGTRALLDWAQTVNVDRFVQISTAYVCGERTGIVPEAVAPSRPPFHNDYERSKWLAEQLVLQWRDVNRTLIICRPSILFGDLKRGRATRMKGLYLIARATELLSRAAADDPDLNRSAIPLRLLGKRDATTNVIPVDWAAEQIARLALDPMPDGPVHHITNPHPPTHAEIKRWLEDYFNIGGGRFCDGQWPLEDPNHYETLFYSLGNVVHDYFRHGLTFESRCADRIPPRRLVDRDHFFACLRYAQSTQWGRGRVRDPGPPSSNGRVDPRFYFERFLPHAVPRSIVARIEALTANIRFTITDQEPGTWACRFEQGHLVEVHPRFNGLDTEFEYRLAYQDFELIVTRRKSVQAVFFQGNIEIVGNVERALKWVPIMGEFLKEHPVH
ncbi:MAG: SDR family oxidoreductase [Phycisphaerae bacterium]